MIAPGEEFVSEPIVPVAGTGDPTAMSRGEPGFPRQFAWRDRSYELAQLRESWKTSSRDRGELYLRRHWYRILTTTGEQMTLYCERQAKNAKKSKSRWWLYSIKPHVGGEGEAPAEP